MNAVVNGARTELPESVSVAELVVRLGHDPKGFGLAVALNGEVVPRSAWPQTSVEEEDRVEVLVASQGG